eukprot:COSAG01_NODE_46147_length_402_cov_5.254125_1_plen_111_part_10
MLGCLLLPRNVSFYSTVLPTFKVLNDEVLQEVMYVVKMNHAAQLSSTPRSLSGAFCTACTILQQASRDKSLHNVLLSSGVLESLLYATANDCTWFHQNSAHVAAMTAVNLI